MAGLASSVLLIETEPQLLMVCVARVVKSLICELNVTEARLLAKAPANVVHTPDGRKPDAVALMTISPKSPAALTEPSAFDVIVVALLHAPAADVPTHVRFEIVTVPPPPVKS